MKVFVRKCIAIALAATCMLGTGALLSNIDNSNISIVANAANSSDRGSGNVTVTGTVSREMLMVNGVGFSSTFKAYRGGKRIKGIVVKDTKGNVIGLANACVNIKTANWTKDKNSNNYATISLKKAGKCIVTIKYNDGNVQTIKITARKYSYSYKDFGYASNFGLVNHGMTAVNQKWISEYGKAQFGAVDCSGLIVTYRNVGGERVYMLGSSQNQGLKWGYVKNGIPRVHGLGLHKTCHVAIYAGGNKTIDSRGTEWAKYVELVDNKSRLQEYTEWFYIVGVKYPVTGWVKVDGRAYYYQNGQYVINCTKKINGVTYKFNASGVSHKYPAESEYKKTQYKVYTK